MIKKALCLSTLALSLSLIQAPAAFADHMACFDNPRVHRMLDKLDITAEQKTKVEAIRGESSKSIMPLHQKMNDLRIQVNDGFATGAMDEAKLKDLINQEKEVFGDILNIRLTERHNISNVLTAEQKTKLAEEVKKWEEKHQKERMKHMEKMEHNEE